MRVTIKDVAAEAGVSFQIVSAILGNRAYARASAETRVKVREAAQKLHYIPNVSARILQGGASRLVGMLVDTMAQEPTFRLLAEMEKAANKRGCRLLISEAHNDPQKLRRECGELVQYGVDGILALAHTYPGLGSILDTPEQNTKIIPIGNIYPGDYSAVVTDIAAGFAMLTRHLLGSGYRHPVLVMPQPALSHSMKERIKGFREVLQQGEIITLQNETTISDELQLQHIHFAVEELRRLGADAALCAQDRLAALLGRELRKNGVRIPQDFGLAGFDNSRFCEFLDVPLTSAEIDFEETAEAAFSLLEKKISGNTQNHYCAIPPRIIVRESSSRTNMKYEI